MMTSAAAAATHRQERVLGAVIGFLCLYVVYKGFKEFS